MYPGEYGSLVNGVYAGFQHRLSVPGAVHSVHGKQELLPATFLYVPNGQAVHAPSCPWSPDPSARHPVKVRPCEHVLHAEQGLVPVFVLYVPAAHATQDPGPFAPPQPDLY